MRFRNIALAFLMLALNGISAILAALGGAMSFYTDASLPYLDAFATVASLIAQWLMGRKVLELSHRRQAFFDHCRQALEVRRRPYVIIRGNWQERFAQACRAVQQLLKQAPTR